MAKENMVVSGEHVISGSRTHTALSLGKLMLRLASNVFAAKRVQHSYKMKKAKLEQEEKKKLGELEVRREELKGAIFALMQKNRSTVEKIAKSITLVTGVVGWRERKPSVEIIEGYTEKGIVEALMKRGRWALRFKPELNKQAILQNFHDKSHRPVKGITIKTGEELFISLAPRGQEKKPEIITMDL